MTFTSAGNGGPAGDCGIFAHGFGYCLTGNVRFKLRGRQQPLRTCPMDVLGA